MYPITILPTWAQHVEMANPFVQILQDVRRVVIGHQEKLGSLATSAAWHAVPLAVTAGMLLLGLWVHLRDAPYFAEKV